MALDEDLSRFNFRSHRVKGDEVLSELMAIEEKDIESSQASIHSDDDDDDSSEEASEEALEDASYMYKSNMDA